MTMPDDGCPWYLQLCHIIVKKSFTYKEYGIELRTVYVLARGLFWCSFPELLSKGGNKHQNNTRMSVWTVHHESTCIILLFKWHNESINDDLHTSNLCLICSFYILLMLSKSMLMRSIWQYNCCTSGRKVISNSLDIDDNYEPSCKKVSYYALFTVLYEQIPSKIAPRNPFFWLSYSLSMLSVFALVSMQYCGC